MHNQCQLRFEPLEDRRLLAVFTVSSLADAGAGTLREVIALANGNGEADTIQFSAIGTVNIQSQLPTITADLTIVGGNQITIDAGGGMTSDAGDGFRIFRIDDGSRETELTVTLAGLTLTGADTPLSDSFGNGGAIYNREQLTLLGSTLTENQARGGAGVWAEEGTLHVVDSTFSRNSASSSGGGIFNNANSTTIVTRSTLSENSGGDGGAIRNNAGTVDISNSTLSANVSIVGGGGLRTVEGVVSISSSTIIGNISSESRGGGISIFGSAITNVTNSIVAGNMAATIDDDIDGTLASDTFNLIGGSPLLAPLADNGGPTRTHALLPGSPAIDTADPALVGGFDQRGFPFDRVFGDRADIGAFERQPQTFVVNSPGDVDDGLPNNGLTTLREAIGLANSNAGMADTIAFDPALSGETIFLTGAELEISDALTIQGPGQDLLTIDAQQMSRVLRFSSTTGDLELMGLSFTGGQSSGPAMEQGGGGIRFDSSGTLSLSHSTVAGNTSNSAGGGIYAYSGDVNLSSSTVSGNSSGFRGGGIYSRHGSASLMNSSVRDNSSTFSGGGVAVYGGGLSLTSSTVSGNTSQNNGGGIAVNRGILSLIGSTVSDNASLSGGGIYGLRSTLDLSGSSISGNTGSSVGGGIVSLYGDLTLTNSTVSGNFGDHGGGGIIKTSGNLTLTSSTVSGNASDAGGGGIISARSDVSLTGSTVSGNKAQATGGGIAVADDAGNHALTIANSILAGNFHQGGLPNDVIPDPDGTLTVSNSLIGVNTSVNLTGAPVGMPDANGNLIGTAASPIDPLLGPLADNGGPTLPNGAAIPTRALLPGSPAINAGFSTEENDQRGLARNDGNGVDMGAYEAQIAPSADFDADGDVDGADFLHWQRGFGKANAARVDGNSDDDADADASDLAAWQVSYGQPQPLAAISIREPLPNLEKQATETQVYAALVDAALALPWLQNDSHELAAEVTQPFTVGAILFVRQSTAERTPGAKPAENADFLAVEAVGQLAVDQPWLADELLERVFD
jgi:hypothetical protein